MSVQRSYERHLQDLAGIRKTRGIPNQFARHIIKQDVKWKNGRYVPRELHATKGWRNVPAWS